MFESGMLYLLCTVTDHLTCPLRFALWRCMKSCDGDSLINTRDCASSLLLYQ